MHSLFFIPYNLTKILVSQNNGNMYIMFTLCVAVAKYTIRYISF